MLPPDCCQGNSRYGACFTTVADMFSFSSANAMIKRFPSILILCLLALLAWFLWQKPAVAPEQKAVRTAMPEMTEQAGAGDRHQSQLWRVVTRRLVSRASVNTLDDRLQEMGLTPIELSMAEEVTVHAFDDATLYKTREEASVAAQLWKGKGFDVNLIKVDDTTYMLGLGRLYQEKHALLLQQKLKRMGMAYRYQRRAVPVTTWRFTFAASDRAGAQQLWQKLENSGVLMPVLMTEVQFQRLYGALVLKPTGTAIR